MSKQNDSTLCNECSIKTTTCWCKPCNAKRFKENFSKWTSNSAEMDKFIRETQLNAERHETLLEWVDPSKFTFLQKVAFSKNKIAYWEDGYLLAWNAEKKEWDRNGRQKVKLVSHYCEKYLTSHFLKLVKNLFLFLIECLFLSTYSIVLLIYRFTV
jgi:hypothetical protein